MSSSRAWRCFRSVYTAAMKCRCGKITSTWDDSCARGASVTLVLRSSCHEGYPCRASTLLRLSSTALWLWWDEQSPVDSKKNYYNRVDNAIPHLFAGPKSQRIIQYDHYLDGFWRGQQARDWSKYHWLRRKIWRSYQRERRSR